jgi:hypothetical protein
MKLDGPAKRFFKPTPTNDEPHSEINSGCFEYGWAYRKAARKLLVDIPEGTFVVLPAVFLYRHAVEMHIKAILLAFGPAVGIQKESVCNRGHDLAKQLSDLESVFKLNGAALSADTIATIRELQRIDPQGTTTRYAEERDGKALRISEGDHFELQPFVSSVEAALTELDGLYWDVATRHSLEFGSHERTTLTTPSRCWKELIMVPA